MIDPKDTATGDLVGGIPKRRGRPSTGKAKSGSERMRELRLRALRCQGDLKSLPNSALYEELAACHRRGFAAHFEMIVDELRSRIPEKSSR